MNLLRQTLISLFVVVCAASTSAAEDSGELLYNGIRLPQKWPPQYEVLATWKPKPQYLEAAPNPIPIDVGRQLFVDDFLIGITSLTRTYHQAVPYEHNPILKPDKPWEIEGPKNPTAMPFSDGVFYDPQDKLFKMWYMASHTKNTAYATSRDGMHWEKPSLDVVPGTNIVSQLERDANTVWLDLEEKDPQRRYKMFTYKIPPNGEILVQTSADGIHWTEAGLVKGVGGDCSTAFYNPFRRVWAYSLRAYVPYISMRIRRYHEGPDFLSAGQWKGHLDPALVLWTCADSLDNRRPDFAAQLYNLDCVAYESVMLGMFTIMHQEHSAGRPKLKDICMGYSRDGFHWYRPERKPVVPLSDKPHDWNWGNLQSVGGCCLVVGDKLYIYSSGRQGVPNKGDSGVCSTGLATLRRDGFASMDADAKGGTLQTRPITFSGKHLFVNVDAAQGELTAELLDEHQRVIEPFTQANCEPVKGDTTLQEVRWKGAGDLSAYAGKPMRFRFHLKNGRFYSFWVSPDAKGASHGYVAAGGPGFTGISDTVGREGQTP
jgi:hypothetical protein